MLNMALYKFRCKYSLRSAILRDSLLILCCVISVRCDNGSIEREREKEEIEPIN